MTLKLIAAYVLLSLVIVGGMVCADWWNERAERRKPAPPLPKNALMHTDQEEVNAQEPQQLMDEKSSS